MRNTRWVVGVLVMVIIGGCGGSASHSVTPVKPPELKSILIQLSESGNLEDVKDVISTQIEKIEVSDSAKAKELSIAFEALRKASSPTEVKDLAKKMADKL